MRKQFSQQILIFAVGCLFLSSCFLPTSSTTIKGKVFDVKKRPVADAEVRFGGTGLETVIKTQADGTFTVSARHRPTQMLNLSVSKTDVGTYSDKFPGFAAPGETVQIELMPSLQTIQLTK